MIRLEHLVKHYGPVRAVDDISFIVNQGEILGLLGPNGAGKSTTMKIMTGYLSPTSGEVQVEDLNISDHSRQIRRMIGYLAENNPLYLEMTVHEFLTFIARVREIPESQVNTTLKRVVERTGLKPMVTKPIYALSKGYRQRVGLAQAILHEPRILILDEPTLGLDPNQNLEIRELIREHGRNKTLIVSSHDLQLIEAVCDRIVIINKGKIAADGTPGELTAGYRGVAKLKVEMIAPETAPKRIEALFNGLRVISVDPGPTLTLEIEHPAEADPRAELAKTIHDQGWTLLEITRETFGLPDLFRKLTLENIAPMTAEAADEADSNESSETGDEALHSDETTPGEDR
jgi:ABC-2 type transport system ATP-binding protein